MSHALDLTLLGASSEKETELIFIALMRDPKELLRSDHKQRIEQWALSTNYPFPGDSEAGVMRVRMYDDKDMEFTTKLYGNADTTGKSYVGHADEHNMPIHKGMFEQVKAMAPIGEIKVRHIFNIPGSDLKWEIDTYYDRNNRVVPWCKVDLEVPADRLKDFKIPPFPIQFDEVITGARTRQQEKKVTDIFDNMFIVRNKRNILPLKV